MISSNKDSGKQYLKCHKRLASNVTQPETIYEEFLTESSFSKPQSHMPAITDILKIVLIGDTNVGKTALVKRLVHDKAPIKESCPTIGVEFAKMPVWDRIKNVAVQVHIWDTAGQEKFRSLTSHHYKGANGALIVFDTTNRDSFLNAQRWLQELRDHSTSQCRVTLIGNKTDLKSQTHPLHHVSRQEAVRLAKQNNMLGYFESSAMWRRNAIMGDGTCSLGIENILERLTHEILGCKDQQEQVYKEQEFFRGSRCNSSNRSYLQHHQPENTLIKIDKRSLFCDSKFSKKSSSKCLTC